MRGGWARTVGALAAPGCVLLVHAIRRGHRGVGPRGIEPTELASLLGDGWLSDGVPAPGWYRYILSIPPGRGLAGPAAAEVERLRAEF
jgi:hypothetical protein